MCKLKRPLLCGCLALAAVIVLWQRLTGPPPWEPELSRELEGQWVTVTGQVYEKEIRTLYGEEILVLYLRSVVVSSDTQSGDGGSVPDNSEQKVNDRLICQLAKDRPAWESVSAEGEISLWEQAALGSRVAVRGKLELYQHATNPGEWDSADYNLIDGVAGQLKQVRLLGSDNRQWRLREGLLNCRRCLSRRLYQALPSREASVLAKMLLGETEGLDRELKTLYQNNGIAHVLAISGLHITLLGMGLYRLLRRCGCPIAWAAVAGGCMILLYGGVVGWGISAARAVGMYLIRMLGEIGTRHYDMLTAMGVLAAGMICHNPRLAYHCGFLLSFGAVAGMGWIYPALLGALEPNKIIRNRLHRTALALLQGLLRGLLASLSVTLFTLPIQLYYFYQIPVYGTLLNLIVLPLMGMLLAGGLVLIALPIALPVRWGVMGILALYEEICSLAECLPGHLWIVGCPSTGQIVGYYGLLTVAVIALQYGQRQERNSQVGRQRLFLWRRRVGLLILTAAVIFLIGRRHSGFSLTMLDVGQGDCICVRTAQGQTYLFDGGSSSRSSAGKYVLIPYLKHQGISVIDGVFLSHGDEDHINAIRELLTDSQGIRIETLYLPQVAEPLAQPLEELRVLAREAGCRVEYLSQGMGWLQGDFRLTCLWPRAGYEGESNASSACYLLEEKSLRILLTGDVEGEGERELTAYLQQLPLAEIEVLKVAHHGSRFSTSETFLQVVTPRLALISAGRDNSYGHPHQELLARLEERGCRVVQTPESGAITLRAEHSGVTKENRLRILTFLE